MLLELTKLSPAVAAVSEYLNCFATSAFSCNHGSSIGTGDDTCPSASSRYFNTAPLTVTPAEVVAAADVRRRL